MSQNRKVKALVETTLKKIKEGLEEFQTIWDKVYESSTQAQKEKNEEDLKKQIKKLQRYRDSLKGWSTSNDSTITQYSTQIASAKAEIEDRMLQFRECEKETKTKAFSKEGLKQRAKQTPEDEKREEVISAIKRYLSELHKQIDDCEVEAKREKNKKRNANKTALTKLEGYLRNHKWHIEHLEQILRQLDNEILDPYSVEPTFDSIDEYLDSYRDKGYVFDDSIYDEFDLDVSLPESSSFEEEPKEEKEVKEPEKEVPLKSVSSIPSIPPLTVMQSKPKVVAPPKVSSPPINYAHVIQRASIRTSESSTHAPPAPKSPQSTTKASPQSTTKSSPQPAAKSQSAAKPPQPTAKPVPSPSQPLATTPSFVPPTSGTGDMVMWNMSEVLEMLAAATATRTPCPRCEPPYFPLCPATVPDSFPQTPLRGICEGSALRQLPDEELLFAFAYPVNECQRTAAARALGEKEWRFCCEQKAWYREVEKDKYEVYDYGTWSIKQDQELKGQVLEKPPIFF